MLEREKYGQYKQQDWGMLISHKVKGYKAAAENDDDEEKKEKLTAEMASS